MKWESYPPSAKPPAILETSYVIRANKLVDDLELPSPVEFEQKVNTSTIIRNKFSLLKDVQPSNYYDLIGEVVKIFDPGDDRLSIYFSDYTANSQFYDYAQDSNSADTSRDGDAYGYTTKAQKQTNDWPGPLGKLTIQLTLYDGNAEYARSHLQPKKWVKLSNVRIDYGKMGGKIEGFLHGDTARPVGGYRIQILENTEEPTEDDKRCIEGIQRRYTYWKKHIEKQRSAAKDKDQNGKHKLDDEPPPGGKKNSKTLRKEKRAAIEAGLLSKSNLNPLSIVPLPRCSIN